MAKTIAIVQARMGSKRLPGKILMRIGEKSIVEHTLSALQKCKKINALYLATGSGAENLPLQEVCSTLGVQIYFGPEENVLQRYWEVLEKEKQEGRDYDYIVRICADSPFIDTEEVDHLIEAHQQRQADLSINYNHPTGLPCGFGVEVISFKALRESMQLAETDEHREHLDEWILQHSQRYRIYYHPVAKEKQSYHLYFTIDTPEDFAFLQGVVSETVKQRKPSFQPLNLLNSVRKNPLLLAPKKMKLFVRADGSGEIGMGHIVRSLTVCDALKEIFQKLEVTYYTSPEAVDTIKEHAYMAKIFEDSLFRRDATLENPDIIIIDLRKHLDGVSSEPLNRALKVRFIDSEIVRNVRGDVLINSFPLAPWPHKKYYSGLQYIPLRKEFSGLPPKPFNKDVKKITIALGGGNQLGEESPGALLVTILSALERFPLEITVIVGSAMSTEAIQKIASYASNKPRIKILQNVNNIHALFYKTDLGISAGGNTLLEFARCEVPTLCISLDYDRLHSGHQQYYCQAMEDAGASLYVGHAPQLDLEKLQKTLQDLMNNPQKRRIMAAQGRALIDDQILEKISILILKAYTEG